MAKPPPEILHVAGGFCHILPPYWPPYLLPPMTYFPPNCSILAPPSAQPGFVAVVDIIVVTSHSREE